MQSENGRRVHGQAEHAREDGDPIGALKLVIEAFDAYENDGDKLGASEVIGSAVLACRHRWQKTGDRDWLILGKAYAVSSVQMAKESGQKGAVVLPTYNLAKVLEDLGEFSEALSAYKETVDNMVNNPPELHNRPGVLADMKIHMEVCAYRNGDKGSIDRILSALADLEKSGEEKYNKDVWMSGAHMSLAEILKNDDPDGAKVHLMKAKEIIDANPDLKLRKEQWEKLASQLPFSRSEIQA
jgi:tetratricopeptide (TPR) repeat protein